MISTPWVSYLILGATGVIMPVLIILWVLSDDRKKTQALKRENNIND